MHTDTKPTDPTAALEALLAHCPPLRGWDPPWDALSPGPDCRGPVADPEAALARLSRDFPDAALEAAGVVGRGPGGAPRLAPALGEPGGALIPLRDAGGGVFDLLTPGGCLRSRELRALAVLRDGWTAARLARAGVLAAAGEIREVALLRALGLPDTLSTGLERAGPREARALGEAHPHPAAGADGAAAAGGSAGARPTLGLLGWEILALRPDVPAGVGRIAARLTKVDQHLGLGPAGIAVWRAGAPCLERVALYLEAGEPGHARGALRESLGEDLYDLDRFAGPGPPPGGPERQGPGDVTEARARLLAGLAEDRAGRRLSDRTREARRRYEAAAQRGLVEPLQRWALAHPDPAVRSPGLEAASVGAMVHALAPLAHELLAREAEHALTRAPARPAERAGADLLRQYAELSTRFVRLLALLGRLREGRP